jgi:glycosyltransferase 2 family protein
MKKNRWILFTAIAVAVAALGAWGSARAHFRWDVLGEQFRHVNWLSIAIATALIYLAYLVRAIRWAVFIREHKKVPLFSLTGTQVVGFTAVALLGRIADPVRSYLVSRKTGLALSSQVAVYTVERMFDLAAMATIFAVGIMVAPDRATLPHPEIVQKIAHTALLGTLFLIAFAITARVSGGPLAASIDARFHGNKLAHGLAEKIRAFRLGLSTISRPGELIAAALLSFLMWAMIAAAYLWTVRAFVLSPELASVTFGRCLVLMAASMVSSVVPLPVISWFVQIGVTAKTIQGFFGAAAEPATGAATMVVLVTMLAIIPVGLVWTRVENLSLGKLAQESEHAEDALEQSA